MIAAAGSGGPSETVRESAGPLELAQALAGPAASHAFAQRFAEQLSGAFGRSVWVLLPGGLPDEAWPVCALAPPAGKPSELPPALPADDARLVALRARPEMGPWGDGLPPPWAVPLFDGEELAGVALIALPTEPSPEERQLLAAASASGCLALAAARRAEEAGEARLELAALAEIARTIAAAPDREEMLGEVARRVALLVPCDHASVALQIRGALVVVASAPESDALPIGASYPAPRAASEWRDLADPGETSGEIGVQLARAGMRSALVLPIPVGGVARGALCVASRAPHALRGAERARLAELAPLVAVALRQAELHADLGSSIGDLLSAQARLVRGERLRALGEMASGVAHDFNNVLNAILHRTALLEAASGVAAREGLRRIEQAARRGAETVRRLQDFTRQRRDTDFSAVDLARVIADAGRAASAAAAGSWGELRVEVQVPPSLPPVVGAHDELVEVVTNLIANALDALGGRGLLQLSARRDGERVVLVVRDDGCGMDATTRDRAFDPFFTTKGVRGTGLGLSVVYGIIERHRGEVTIDSEPGRGTAIRVALPVAGSLTPPSVPAARAGRRPPRGTRVLLIEDDEVNREATRALLEFAGLKVVEAASGSEGIAAHRPGAFDVVLSDLGMPDRSGWEVARAIKEREPCVPVALITGWGLTISEQEGRERGVALIIKKPVTPPHLLELLADLLKR